MEILVIDSDAAIKEYYTNLLESEFRSVQVRFSSSGSGALSELEARPADIVLTEASVHGGAEPSIFSFLQTLTERRVPCVVVAAEGSERLIVECLRSGALDFVTKRNIKLGHLPAVIARALLEAGRWQKIRSYEASVPHRDEYHRLNDRLRGYVDAERREEERATLVRKGSVESDAEFVPGQSYFIIYLFLQLYMPPELRQGSDPRRFATLQGRVLDKFVEIAPRYGGRLWTRKEDGCFFAFTGDSYLSALLAAIELRASLHIFNMTVENLNARIETNIARSCGETVYKSDHGEIYSEALNLAAHMAINKNESSATLLTSQIYEQLDARARKYLFKAGTFEGYEVYRYEAIG